MLHTLTLIFTLQQIPSHRFGETYIIGSGVAMYVAVLLLKFPIVFLSVKFRSIKAEGLTFQPWVRDILLLGTALAYQSDLSFLVASYAFGSNIFSEDTYAIVFLALILSLTVTLFLLQGIMNYFDKEIPWWPGI